VRRAKAVDAGATTAADICRVLVAPATAQLSGPDPLKTYLRLLEGLKGEDGKLLVAPSTHFISHAWRYDLAATVLEVMEEMDRETGGTAYFW
jgi:hypothetical protein